MTRPHARHLTRPAAGVLIAAAALGALTLAGCIPGYYAGGSLASRDLFTYYSTQDYPTTVTLVDTRTGEQIWSCDIPIGQQLVIQFFDDHNEKSPDRPALMRWQLMRIETHGGSLENTLPAPDFRDRRVDVTLRKLSGEPARGTMNTNPDRP